MRVLIINSPLFRDENPLYDEDSLPPIGLGYIATMLELEKVNVQLIDAVADRIPLIELQNKIKKLQPDVVAINIFTTNYELVKELIENIVDINVRVIIGGLSTRTLYENIFSWKYKGKIDIIFGDGELIVPDIIYNKETQLPNNERNNRRFFKVDSLSGYFCRNISYLPLNRSFFSNEPIFHPLGFIEANIVASRGCIYNCAFCAAARSLNTDFKIRERTTKSLIKELNDISEQFPNVNSIRILDDLFLKGKDSIATAIEVFSHFKFQWRSMAHVMTFQNVSLDELLKLKKSGCSELFIGIESGSPRILKSIHKTHDINKIKNNLSIVLQAGISLKCYFIYGFPTETKEDFEKTYKLACYLKELALSNSTNFRTSVFQFRPYHGTELFHSLKQSEFNGTNVEQIKGNKELSSLVGRLQFNFHSGNYSSENNELLQNYIYQTINLTSLAQWGVS